MNPPTKVDASPTKEFFAKMLTRDIELRDAILDLLDNCLDGILRTGKLKPDNKTPYQGYEANITANPGKFVIEDNCGGIPKDVAKDVAFRLGRPSTVKRENLETVGVYGIGMKRAIFKLGRNAVVTSEHRGTRFEVRIDDHWLKNDSLWDLKLEETKATGRDGTRIEVTELYPEIKRDFTSGKSIFLTESLPVAIRELYSVIMGKGFVVKLNGSPLEPVEFKLLVTNKAPKVGISPYIFKGKFGKVTAEIMVGFYRRPLTASEIEEENEAPKADLRQAGWSVICNDRLILRSDKTAVTGWGTGTVPRFHNQFSSIAGVVILNSTEPELLPLNTTKRGIETSSDVYFRLLDYMRTGVKQFTDFTNRWKDRSEEAREQFRDVSSMNPNEIRDAVLPNSFRQINPRKLVAENAEAKEYKPELPSPAREVASTRRIVFTRELSDITLLAEELLEDGNAAPGRVGEECFDLQLKRIKKSRR